MRWRNRSNSAACAKEAALSLAESSDIEAERDKEEMERIEKRVEERPANLSLECRR